MFFGSDNSSPAHPSILDALVDANKGYTSGYGHEEHWQQLRNLGKQFFAINTPT